MPVEPSIDPFPGLRPFEAHEGHLFFGREGQSEETLRRLRLHRFVAVVGSSGSGKSSLVRAGLLPYLYGGFLAGAGSHWRIALFRPGSDPIGNLARALNDPAVAGKPGEDPDAAVQNATLMEVSLRRSGLGLIDAIQLAALPEQEQVLVVVDQFEELFRFAGAVDKPRHENDAAAFVKLLLEASAQREVPIYVVLTMRSDFIGDCARYRGLPEAVTTGLYLIPRMTREERRAAIVEPVRVGGGSIAPRLVNRLLNDVGEDPDQLPILQHALMRTWDYWKTHGGDRRAIDIEDYLAIGGMADALSQHADEAYDSLPDDRHRVVARRVFQALSEKGADHRETRRPTSVETLAQVAAASVAEIINVLEEFRRPGRSFVMPAAGVSLEPSTVIDISHESLIRGWQRLRQWVDDETESARGYRRLAETAELHARGTAGLWHDPDLQHALEWRDNERPTETWGKRYHPGFAPAMAFLDESRTARDNQRRRETNHRHRVLGATAAAAAAMTALAIFSWLKWAEAERNSIEAQRHSIEAQRHSIEAQRHSIDAQHERDRAKQALSALAQITDTVVFGVVQDLRRYRMERTLTRNILDRAIRSYDQTIALNPNAEAYRGRGAAYRMKGDLDRAIADANEAIRLDPKYAHAYNSRGIIYEEKNDFDRAIADYDHAILLNPNNALYYNNRGNVYHNKNDYDHAIVDYDRAIALDPKNVSAYTRRGNAHKARGDLDRAIADYDHAIALNPKDALAYGNRGLAYYDKSDYDHAIADYDQAINLDPKYDWAYNSRGLVYFNKKDYEHAIADYNQATKIDPKNKFPYYNRGNVYLDKGDYDRAIAQYDQAIGIDPNYGVAYNNRGRAYYNKKNYDSAEADFNRAIAANPKNKFPYFNRANIYLDRGDYNRAIAEYDQAIALDPKYAIAYNGRCRARVILGRQLEQALSDCNEALRIAPNYAYALDSRGFVYFKLGRLDDAITDLDAALTINPKFPSSLYGRALAKLKKGDFAGADADMAAAKAIKPDIGEELARYGIR